MQPSILTKKPYICGGITILWFMLFKVHQFLFLVFFSIFAVLPGFGQHSNLGHPLVRNYTKKQYHSGIETRDIAQHWNGNMLFANNGGLLSFNGKEWHIESSKRMLLRQILVDSQNIIYCGGHNTIGYFFEERTGEPAYHSLTNELQSADKIFGDIWEISKVGESIFFRASRKIFQYKNDSIHVFSTDQYFPFVGAIDGHTVVFTSRVGFQQLEADSLIIINNNPKYIDEHIITILSHASKGNIIFTEKNGLLIYKDNKISPWNIPSTKFLKDKRITTAIRLSAGRIAIGTQLGGIIIIDNNGKTLDLFNKSSGLKSNYIRALFQDKDDNLWGAHEKGIDIIAIDAPLRFIGEEEGLSGIGYVVKIWHNHLYFGTSTGLYVMDWEDGYNSLKKKIPTPVLNASGQVWNLDIIGDELIMSHHDGVFRISNNKATKIEGAGIGSWGFIPLPNHPDIFINGNYRGLAIYNRKNGKLNLSHQLKGFDFTSRNICVFDNKIWISHAFNGIFCITLTKDSNEILAIEKYQIEGVNAQASNFFITVIDKNLYCTTKKGLYLFNKNDNRFEAEEQWSPKIGSSIKKLFHFPNDSTLYFVTQNDIGFLRPFSPKGIPIKKSIIPAPVNMLVGGFEYIYPYKKKLVFLATEDGFLLYHHRSIISRSLRVVLNSIKACSSIDNCAVHRRMDGEDLIFHHKTKSIQFDYVAPYFSPLYTVQYQYQLKGYDEAWSAWSTISQRTFTGLPAGKYTFNIKARKSNTGEKVSPVFTCDFEILPVWYLSQTAKFIYLLSFLLFTLGLLLYPKIKIKKITLALEQKQEEIIKEHNEILEEKEEVIEQTEKELNNIKTQKLQNELDFKNRELMSTTLHLTKKNEVIQNLKIALEDLSKKTTQPETTKILKKLIRVIKSHENTDNDWAHFTRHFESVHQGFFRALQEDHPNLSPRDIRLCAYLRLNLNTKEIAPLLGISIRGVEISRYRLRKKLHLDKSENLTEYMMRYN